MLGICFRDVQTVAVLDVDEPSIVHPTDAVVRVSMAGLCGSDLHPYFGREVGIDAGTVMGHEFVGEVVATGEQVQQLAVGDRVASPFTTSCGECFNCRSGLTSRCSRGQLFGWRERGEGLHGGQAQLVRVPLADGTLVGIDDSISDEMALLLGDNLSTGFFAAELAGVQAGGVYAVIGCGTVGLMALVATLRTKATTVIAVDPNASRRRRAEELGAYAVADDRQAEQLSQQLTDGRGVDAAMELVGLPEAQQLAFRLVRPGGTIATIGCHCTPHFAFSPADAYDKNLTYRAGRCPARYLMTRLKQSLQDEPLDLSWAITHRFEIEAGVEAYRVFSGSDDQCIKAVIEM